MATPAPLSAGEFDGLPDGPIQVPDRAVWHTMGFALTWVLGLAFWLLALLVLMGS
jgi:hypothetical protein